MLGRQEDWEYILVTTMMHILLTIVKTCAARRFTSAQNLPATNESTTQKLTKNW